MVWKGMEEGLSNWPFLCLGRKLILTNPLLIQEVVAGMMDLPPHLWRKPRFQNARDNQERQKAFLQKWQKYDWTAALEGGEFEQ
jgi:hypothetical protein